MEKDIGEEIISGLKELEKQLDELNQREATAKAEAEKPAEKKPEKK